MDIHKKLLIDGVLLLVIITEEIAEKIETLRWIQNLDTVKGVRIENYNNVEINTPEDVNIWYSRRDNE